MNTTRLLQPLLVLTLGLLLGAPAAQAEWFHLDEPLMGTKVSVDLWHEDRDAGEAAARAVMAEYHRINQTMSTYLEDSEISLVNREAAKRPVAVGESLFYVVSRAQEISAASDGAFDITFDSVGRHYDFRGGVAPDEATIAADLETIDYRLIELDPERRTIRFKRDGVRINLGGIAKGYAVERGAQILSQRGIQHALLNAGGDSRVIGDRRGQPWIVGIRDPRADEQVVARIPLINEAISTSGDYERYFERDGVRYHHILNPDTGKPAREIRSVSIIGPDATTTDGLTKTVFVLGVEKGMQVVSRFPGYEAIVVDGEGRMIYSDGLRPPESE